MSFRFLLLFKRGCSLVKGTIRFLIGVVRYKKFGWSSMVISPILVTPKCIEIGRAVEIYWHARIQGVRNFTGVDYSPRIIIEDGVGIQQNLHLTCANYIRIGKDTSISANVTITDINHPYYDINTPPKRQKLEVGYVEIGEQCAIYNNAVILPNVKIGHHVIIGANSVITRSIPDYCVAIGAPAIIVKRYDFENCMWRKTDSLGNFIL